MNHNIEQTLAMLRLLIIITHIFQTIYIQHIIWLDISLFTFFITTSDIIAKLQIQPESGRLYIQVVVVVVRAPRFSKQEQTCLRPDHGLTFLTP